MTGTRYWRRYRRSRRRTARPRPGKAFNAKRSICEGSVGAQGGSLAATQTSALLVGIPLLAVRLRLLHSPLVSLQGAIVVLHEFLVALLPILAVLLQVAFDTFACYIGVWRHEFHNSGWTGMLEAYIENGGYEISM